MASGDARGRAHRARHKLRPAAASRAGDPRAWRTLARARRGHRGARPCRSPGRLAVAARLPLPRPLRVGHHHGNGARRVSLRRQRRPRVHRHAGRVRRSQSRSAASLALPGVAVAPLAPSDLPAGAREGLAVVFADDSARYRLAFDERTLLVAAAGPLDLSPITSGEVTARFADFRRAGTLILPFETTYARADAPLAEERVRAACPDPPGLGPEAFVAPDRLPRCP